MNSQIIAGICGALFLTGCHAKKEAPPEKETIAEKLPAPPPRLKIGDTAILLRGQTTKMTDGAIELIVNQNVTQYQGYPIGTTLKVKCHMQTPPSEAFVEKFKNELQFRNIWVVIPLLTGSPKEIDADIWKKESNPESDIPENRK